MTLTFLRRAAVLTCLLSLSATGAWGFQSKEFSKTVAFRAGDRLSIKTYKGSIHLSSWDQPEVSIYARIAPPEGESDEYAAAVVEATRVEVRRSGDTLRIRSDYDDVPTKKSWGKWFGESKNLAYVHYDVKAPRTLNLRVDDYKSDIEIYGFSGDFDIETYKGALTASDLDGRFRLETYKGRAEVSAVRGAVDVETFKGEVSIQAVAIENDSKLQTYKGTIVLSMPGNQGLDLRADLGRRGSLHSDFEVAAESGIKKRRSSRRLESAVNEGGPRLEVSTNKGEIRLLRW